MSDQNDAPQGERVRIDVAEYRKIHLGTLEVGTDGAITIRPPAKADAPGGTVQDITTTGRRGRQTQQDHA